MKAVRVIYFVLFAFSALISVNLLYNLFAAGYGIRLSVVLAISYIAIQVAGLISVIVNRSRVLSGILSAFVGIATMLSGFMTFASLGAPAPKGLGIISFVSMITSLALLVGYMVLCVLFFVLKPTDYMKRGTDLNK